MFIPGNNASMIKDAHIYGADSLMFDLEDSVSINEKDSARLLVYNALKSIDYQGVETVVRINTMDTFGEQDVLAMVHAKVDVIRLPKTETVQDIKEVDDAISKAEKLCGQTIGRTKMMAAIEGPLGAINAYQIATASKRIIGIALGAEDYVTSMKTKRHSDGHELLAARSAIVMAARAAKIYAIDTVFSNVNDEEGLRNEVKLIKQLGFDGKSVINPRQINVVHELFTPTEEEVEKALKIIVAIKEAEEKGSGVASLNGKMIDKPIVARAMRTLQTAKASGMDVENF